jgi:integrase/recombinase XerD
LKGKTPLLSLDEARRLFDSIETSTDIGLSDGGLIGLMVVRGRRRGARDENRGCFCSKPAPVGARFLEKGGKHQEMPCQHNLEIYLHEYLD